MSEPADEPTASASDIQGGPDAHTHRRDGEGLYVTSLPPDAALLATLGQRPVSIGLHPWHLQDCTVDAELALLETLLTRPNVVAVGECGLDRCVEVPFDLQQRALAAQLRLAKSLRKPVVLHCVRAFGELAGCWKAVAPGVPALIHGFNNKPATALSLLRHGFLFSFGQALLNEGSNAAATLRALPLDRILLETDDAPIEINVIYEAAARRRDMPLPAFQAVIQANFERFYGLPVGNLASEEGRASREIQA